MRAVSDKFLATAAQRPLRHGLRLRLLALTVIFVMLAEVLIFVPSVANFRLGWLNNRLAEAHLAALSLEAAPDDMVTAELETKLLAHVGAVFIDVEDFSVRVPGRRRSYVLGSMHGVPMATHFELPEQGPTALIADALQVYFAPDDRIISVRGRSPKDEKVWVRVVFNEMPLADAIVDYGLRILGLSIFISIITAGLLLVALNWMLVRPLRQLTASVLAFAANPEAADAVLHPPARDDEVGTAMRELAAMQTVVRAALKQRERLAALGTAVTKINHDLRNMLSTASLVSESLTLIDDPKVQKVAPRLYAAINRAVGLCEQTLAYSRSGTVTLARSAFPLGDLIHDVCEELRTVHGAEAPIACAVPDHLRINADRDQLFRVLLNLGRNALEAGATEVAVEAQSAADGVILRIRDNGPGLAPRARDNLFQPFAGTARAGGTGLGLAIAREILRAHGGDLSLEHNGADGCIFRIDLPGCATGSD